ncbi:DDE-type integrase/transposase/recombinase [Promicromonospora sukumoe]|uniref:Transposase InsO family protein n=1 Tax=Promicromonospora sukumoe TaxID=88382 RepID=A0A7W3PDZ9_9MICO|nr:Mu transposase C-terminal domain-containing protein [Promicromonospora sukumoe]MBA8808062.1 transposase InsO family protein [Promicromonospora sukumoe]
MSVRNTSLRLRDTLRLGTQTWSVGAIHDGTVHLTAPGRASMTITVSALLGDPTFEVVGDRRARGPLGGTALFDGLPEPVQKRARWWEQHVTEVIDGVPCTASPGTPAKLEYDPQRRTLHEREKSKHEELTGAGETLSLRTVKRMRRDYERDGLLGLADKRFVPTRPVAGRADPRVVDALREVLAQNTHQSSGTVMRLEREVRAVLERTHGPGAVPMPSESTFRRLLKRLAEGRHATGSARTRRTLAQQPDRMFGAVAPVRPGELVEVDSTPLDVAVVLADGFVGRVELTAMVDVATRTIAAAVLRPTTKAVDAALLLARAMTPEPMRPGWPQAISMAHSVLPFQAMRSIDQRLEGAAARPVIVPETVVYDHGKVYLSTAFRNACRTLGITLQPAHPDTPTDKPHVERTLQSVGTLFAQHVAGYLGSSVERRGKNAEAAAAFSLVELQDLLDEWIVTGWQNRPHDGLRDPLSPGQLLTPNEKYAALLQVAGYIPVPLSQDDFVELLPAQTRKINSYGVKIDHRVYDAPELNPLRGQRSGVSAFNDLWEVHYDPYDITRVWLRNHHATEREWITLWWRHLNAAPVPFGQDAWNAARQIAAQRGDGTPSQEKITALVDDILTRASTPPERAAATRGSGRRRTSSSRKEQRVAARTSAASEVRGNDPVIPKTPRPEPAEPAPPAPELEDTADDDSLAEVIPLGVFDPHEEAKHWW